MIPSDSRQPGEAGQLSAFLFASYLQHDEVVLVVPDPMSSVCQNSNWRVSKGILSTGNGLPSAQYLTGVERTPGTPLLLSK